MERDQELSADWESTRRGTDRMAMGVKFEVRTERDETVLIECERVPLRQRMCSAQNVRNDALYRELPAAMQPRVRH